MLLLGLSACAEDIIPVHVYGLEAEEAEQLLNDVEQKIQFPVVDIGRNYGAVRIDILAETPDERFFGHTEVVSGCKRRIWALHNANVVAHELGHVFGLGHVDDQWNLMHKHFTFGEELSQKQLDKIERRLEVFDACPFSD